jgi:hypothetical protein
MKPIYSLIIFLPFMLWLTGCDETRPGIIQKLIFSEGDQWLDRDVQDDPYELVDSLCCNDYYPYPLPIDTTIHPVIAPAGDLDYFNLQVSGNGTGWLSLSSDEDSISMRIFSRDMEEYDFLLDTLYSSPSDNFEPSYWTTLYGPDSSFTLLIQGQSRSQEGRYSLDWKSATIEDGLKIIYPKAGYRWGRTNTETIEWASHQSDSVSAALLRGPVIVRFLKSGDEAVYNEDRPELVWHIPDDLEVGDGYRIMIYLTAKPKKMNISDEFEIYEIN